MVTYTKIAIGILILILVSTGIVYVQFSNNAKVRVDYDKSVFYVPSATYSWLISGTEYNKLYNGNTLVNRITSNITIEKTYDSNSITIKRTTPYQNGAKIIDTYFFNGNEKSIELFPIYHKVEVLNAQGLFYRYDVKNLVYNSSTFKLDGSQTSMSFGRNMKVTWWEGYSLGYIYSTGSMYVKSKKINSDYEVFNVRLFDPESGGLNVTLYLDGVNNTRKYEYFTYANITANVTGCTPNLEDDDTEDSYACEGTFFDPCANAVDENWNNFAFVNAGLNGTIWENYTKPSNVIGANWTLKYNVDTTTGDKFTIYFWNYTADDWSLLTNITGSPGGGVNVTIEVPSIGITGSNVRIKTFWYNALNDQAAYYEGKVTWITRDCTVCVDIDDSINNITLPLGNKNYSCGNSSISFGYNITLLRVNQFNDTSVSKNVTTRSSLYISLDNRTDLTSFVFNLSSTNTTGSSWCFQEQANESTNCGGLDTGGYTNKSNWSDGNHSTYINLSAGDTEEFLWNYSVPTGLYSNISLMQYDRRLACIVEGSSIPPPTSTNYSLTNCINTNKSVLQFNLSKKAGGTGRKLNLSCNNNLLVSENIADFCVNMAVRAFFEESMFWNMSNASMGSNSSVNITIDVNNDTTPDVNLLGSLTGTDLLLDYFYFESSKVSVTNLSRVIAGTKTIYVNTSTSGLNNPNNVENISFRLDGFNVDDGNSLNFTENFSHPYNGTFNTNMSLFSAIVDFYDNKSLNATPGFKVITGAESLLSIQNPFSVNNSYLNFHTTGCGSSPCTETDSYKIELDNFDTRKTYQFQTKLRQTCTFYLNPCGGGGLTRYDGSQDYYLTDGTTNVEIYSENFCSGDSTTHTGSLDKWLNISGNKTSVNSWDIFKGNTYYRTVSTSTLNPNVKPYLKFQLRDSCTCGGAGSGGTCSISNVLQIYNLNVTGISLKMNASNYTLSTTNYTSDSLGVRSGYIRRATISADVYNPTGTRVIYYLSNDNQTTWEQTTNGTTHVFTSEGKNLSARFLLNSSNVSLSPIVYSYDVHVTPSAVTNVLVDVGGDNVIEWNYTGVLDSASSPQYFRDNGTAISNYTGNTCPLNATCYVPIVITFGTAGTLQVRDFNFTFNPNPISVTPSLVETFNPIQMNFSYVGGLVQISNLKLDFRGSKNITFFAHFWNNTGFNNTQIMQVRYSKFNVSLPVNVSYWEVFPRTKNDKNVTPFGQTNTSAIWNITSLAYDDSFDVYIKVNKTLNSCLNITFTNVTLNSSIKTGLVVNTTSQRSCYNVNTLQNNGTCGNWNWVDLTNCSIRFELPWFYWSTICTDCVNTTDFDKNYIIR